MYPYDDLDAPQPRESGGEESVQDERGRRLQVSRIPGPQPGEDVVDFLIRALTGYRRCQNCDD